MALGDSWQVETLDDPLRKSLVDRAKKRKVVQGKEPGSWVIIGRGDLGDKYDTYLVEKIDGQWVCDCFKSDHGGSRARKGCSHVTGAILAERGDIKTATPHEPDHFDSPLGTKLSDGKSGGISRSPIDPSRKWRKKESVKASGAEASRSISSTPPRQKIKWTSLAEVTRDPPGQEDEGEVRPETIPLPLVPTPQNISVLADEPPMPAKFVEYRNDQWQAVEEIVSAFEQGFKVVMLSAPTGSGKTLLAESVRRRLGVEAIYTCTEKTLQDQVMNDYGEYAKVLKGRANYPTLDDPDATADDCTWSLGRKLPACPRCPGWEGGQSWGFNADHEEDEEEGPQKSPAHCVNCHPVDDCPYLVARREAEKARLAVLNTAYFLAETSYNPKTGFKRWPLLIIDEADKLEDQLMGFVEMSVSPQTRKQLKVGLPEKKTVDEAWVDWIDNGLIPAAERRETGLKAQLSLLPEDVKLRRERKRLNELRMKMKALTTLAPTETGELRPVLQQGWVYTGYEGKSDDYTTVTFKPIKVAEYAEELLWSKAKRIILMSATLVSPEQMAEDLGIEDGSWTVVEMPSSFPVLRRPVYPRTVASVTHKTKETSHPIVAREVMEICREWPDQRVLVHTVSYELMRAIENEMWGDERLTSRLVTYTQSRFRDTALAKYLSRPNSILLAPSFERGVDLADDDCRVVVVAKVPFPHLGDKQVSARLYSTGRSGRLWFTVQAIRSLCQMTGRGMRSAGDWCVSYVLDEEFERLYRENRRLFPQWWSEAIVWDRNDPRWKEVVA